MQTWCELFPQESTSILTKYLDKASVSAILNLKEKIVFLICSEIKNIVFIYECCDLSTSVRAVMLSYLIMSCDVKMYCDEMSRA